MTERATGRRDWKENYNKNGPPSKRAGALSFACEYGIIWLGVLDKRQAVCPSGSTLCGQGHFFALLTVRKGGTNSDRVQRTKQGAVSGAALRFLQAPAVARRKKRLSARGPAMVTYSDLIQTGILIIGLIDLVLRLIDADRNKRQ